MTKKDYPDLPASSDNQEQTLWQMLGEVEFAQPSERLRSGFYAQLERARRPGFLQRAARFLGMSSQAGWVTAAACLLLGAGMAQLLPGAVSRTGSASDARLATLEQNVMRLNRELILDRLAHQQPGKRMRGVMDAAALADSDPEIADALLSLAAHDRVDSVRSAAVESLGQTVTSATIGAPLMELLENTRSPLVQLALVDLVLRNGSREQLDALLELAEQERLLPELQQHIFNAFNREST